MFNWHFFASQVLHLLKKNQEKQKQNSQAKLVDADENNVQQGDKIYFQI